MQQQALSTTCVKKKALIQNTAGGPLASQASKNARRSSTSRTYEPRDLRLGKLRRSHDAGTWRHRGSSEQQAGTQAAWRLRSHVMHMRAACDDSTGACCLRRAAPEMQPHSCCTILSWRRGIKLPCTCAHLPIEQRAPQCLQLSADDRQPGTRLAQRVQARAHHAQQPVEAAQLLRMRRSGNGISGRCSNTAASVA